MAMPTHFAITIFLWVLFRAGDWAGAESFYAVMLGLKSGANAAETFYEQTGIFWILLATTAALYIFHFIENKMNSMRSIYVLKRFDSAFLWSFLISIIVLIILLPRGDINPFIYFRF